MHDHSNNSHAPDVPEGWDGLPRMYAAAYQSRGLRSALDHLVLSVFSHYRDVHGTSPTYEQMCDFDPDLMKDTSPEYVSLSLSRLVESGYLIVTDAGLVTLTAADLRSGL